MLLLLGCSLGHIQLSSVEESSRLGEGDLHDRIAGEGVSANPDFMFKVVLLIFI